MIGDLFDSPWKILIVAVVLIVLFGSKKLPDAARSLGKSMRILKTEVGSLHEDEPAAATSATAYSAPPVAPSQPAPSGGGRLPSCHARMKLGMAISWRKSDRSVE